MTCSYGPEDVIAIRALKLPADGHPCSQSVATTAPKALQRRSRITNQFLILIVLPAGWIQGGPCLPQWLWGARLHGVLPRP